MSNNSVRQVDQSALRVNQALIIVFLLLAFILSSPLIVSFVAAVMLVGTVAPQLALFQQFYRRILKPAGIVRPRVIEDNPEPHRFAQGLGGTFVLLGLLALLVGLPVVGWGLVWLVIGLAAANLFLGFCAGCFFYYQLNRLGAPGFKHSRLQGDDA
jgi:Domain of unknown function (DUF4395)